MVINKIEVTELYNEMYTVLVEGLGTRVSDSVEDFFILCCITFIASPGAPDYGELIEVLANEATYSLNPEDDPENDLPYTLIYNNFDLLNKLYGTIKINIVNTYCKTDDLPEITLKFTINKVYALLEVHGPLYNGPVFNYNSPSDEITVYNITSEYILFKKILKNYTLHNTNLALSDTILSILFVATIEIILGENSTNTVVTSKVLSDGVETLLNNIIIEDTLEFISAVNLFYDNELNRIETLIKGIKPTIQPKYTIHSWGMVGETLYIGVAYDRD